MALDDRNSEVFLEHLKSVRKDSQPVAWAV